MEATQSLELGVNAAAAPVATAPGTATSHGYWLVGSDGGIFTFGSAEFYGSTGESQAPAPGGGHRAHG